MGTLDYLVANRPIHRWLNHRNLYLLGIGTLLCGLSWSNALMSIGLGILIGNWVLSFEFKKKWKALLNNKIVWLLLSLYVLHLLGLIWSENTSYGLKDLRIKLPLLFLPLIIGTTKKIQRKEWKVLVSIYLTTVVSLTFASLYKLLGFSNSIILDKRELSIYISHIRYGLNIALASILAFRFRALLFQKRQGLAALVIIWLAASLILFELYTGLLCFLLIISVYALATLFSPKVNRLWKIAGVIAIISIISSQFILVKQVYQDYSTTLVSPYDQTAHVKMFSAGGEEYWHEYESTQTENGIYVRRFVAWGELERAWKRRSQFDFRGKDKKGNVLHSTLNRYLSSRGLKKDSVGFSQLENEEIRAIESGVANVYYLTHNQIENRIHNTFYEIDRYRQTGNANGYSLALRFEYWKTAWHIVKQNRWIGVGTGNIKDAFQQQYELDHSLLDKAFRKRAHNQYLTFLATFGILGLFIFLAVLTVPLLFRQNNFKTYFAFWIIACLSFITEDTLETQAGVTFFALFNTLFLLGFEHFRPISSDK